jgi:cytochrome c oxidase cbb3-type subunit I/II
MYSPKDVSTGSIMPAYPWLAEQQINLSETAGKITALRKVGVPYEPGYEDIANEDLQRQATGITALLKADGIETAEDAEIIALIAYLQRLGTDIKAEKVADNQ